MMPPKAEWAVQLVQRCWSYISMAAKRSLSPTLLTVARDSLRGAPLGYIEEQDQSLDAALTRIP